MGLVNVPRGSCIRRGIMLPSGSELRESPVNKRVFSPVVGESESIGLGHFDLVVHKRAFCRDRGRCNGSVNTHVFGGVQSELNLETVLP